MNDCYIDWFNEQRESNEQFDDAWLLYDEELDNEGLNEVDATSHSVELDEPPIVHIPPEPPIVRDEEG